MNYIDLKRKQNTAMLKARIRFTHKCLMKLALNGVINTDKQGFSAELHSIFTPIAPNYSLN